MRRRALVAVLVAAGVGVLAASPAWAHDELTSSDPKAGATVQTAPQAVTLTFDEPVNARFVRVGVARDGKPVPAEKPVVDGVTVRQRLEAPSPGAYAVSYRIVSTDGHPVTGSVQFTLAVPAAGGAGAPVKAAPTAAPVPTVQIGSADATADSRGRTRVLLIGAVVMFVLVGIAVGGLWISSAAGRRPKRRESP